MARFFVYSTKEAAAALNDDYSTAVEAFFRNDVSFQPE